VSKIYEELVLKRPPEQLVQISASPLLGGREGSEAGSDEKCGAGRA
jgi:hypothetical protein